MSSPATGDTEVRRRLVPGQDTVGRLLVLDVETRKPAQTAVPRIPELYRKMEQDSRAVK